MWVREPVDEELKPGFIFLWKVFTSLTDPTKFWSCIPPHLIDNVLATNWWKKADKANEAKVRYSWSDKICRQHRIWQLRVSAYRIVQLISTRKDAINKHEPPIRFKAFICDRWIGDITILYIVYDMWGLWWANTPKTYWFAKTPPNSCCSQKKR